MRLCELSNCYARTYAEIQWPAWLQDEALNGLPETLCRKHYLDIARALKASRAVQPPSPQDANLSP